MRFGIKLRVVLACMSLGCAWSPLAGTQLGEHAKDITKSGKIFLEACAAVDKASDQLSSFETHTIVQCLSYADGIFETMSLMDNLNLEPRGFCAPKQALERKQIVQIVRKYIGDHPESSNERTVVLAWAGLSQAFPCFGSTT